MPRFLDRFSVAEALCGKRVRVLLPVSRVLGVDLDDLVHAGDVQHDATVDRVGAAAQARAGAS